MASARQGNGVRDARPDSEKSVAAEGLSDALVRGLSAPASGSRITYDRGKDRVRGFGCRVTAAGTKAFILNYTVAGRERRLTIGEYPLRNSTLQSHYLEIPGSGRLVQVALP